MTHAVKIDLPKASSEPQVTETEHIALSIDGDGQLFWNEAIVSREQINGQLQQLPQPELHMRADQAVPYRFVAEALADAAKAGVTRIGFVSDPDKSNTR
jgi:biopolymer transport protein ExbD